MKNILITGASGYLARYVADIFSEKGYNVTLLDIRASKFKKKNQKMVIGNLNNAKKIDLALKNIHTVLHFAASADLDESNKNPFKTIENNVLGTISLLRACLKMKVKKIIFASSIYAISEQGGIYSTSKLSSEMIIERVCKKFNLKFVILRFGSVYGGVANNFNTIQKFIKSAKIKKSIYRNTKGDEVRSYIHILDVARIVYESIKKKYENGYYNVFGGTKTTVKKLLYAIRDQIPGLKISFSKKDIRKYNYKKNPFTYRLRKGKNIKLKKYISLKKGIRDIVNS